MIEESELFNQEVSELQYLISLGMKGSHILFDNERIRKAFNNGFDGVPASGVVDFKEINKIVKTILNTRGVEEKKQLIESLPPETQDVLIVLYFQMIGRNLQLNDTTFQ